MKYLQDYLSKPQAKLEKSLMHSMHLVSNSLTRENNQTLNMYV